MLVNQHDQLRGGGLPAGRAQRPLTRGAAGSAQSAPARCGSSTARWDKAPPVRTRPHPLAQSGETAAWFCVGLSAATRSRILRKVRADFRRIRYACRPAPHHARAREARRGRRAAREMLARRRSNAARASARGAGRCEVRRARRGRAPCSSTSGSRGSAPTRGRPSPSPASQRLFRRRPSYSEASYSEPTAGPAGRAAGCSDVTGLRGLGCRAGKSDRGGARCAARGWGAGASQGGRFRRFDTPRVGISPQKSYEGGGGME
jgi:hypothetical protein